jgi:carboxypeptidase C (cathepsin A)
MPYFTPPAPYALKDNPETLLFQTDMVFINPVGTGYSAAISPAKNGDFWGVDEDARSVCQFIKRFLSVYRRWNSPKYLFGESYGTPRTCVLSWFLHEDGIDLNGVVLLSSILDYSQENNPVGLLPTLAADAWFHKKVSVTPPPEELRPFLNAVEIFARGPYAAALTRFPDVDIKTLQYLSEIIGIPAVVLRYWKLDPSTANATVYLTSLLQDVGLAIGSYDGRVTGEDTGIAGHVADQSSGDDDPAMTAIGGVFTAMWNIYLNEELGFIGQIPVYHHQQPRLP